MDAYVRPIVDRYLASLTSALAATASIARLDDWKNTLSLLHAALGRLTPALLNSERMASQLRGQRLLTAVLLVPLIAFAARRRVAVPPQPNWPVPPPLP